MRIGLIDSLLQMLLPASGSGVAVSEPEDRVPENESRPQNDSPDTVDNHAVKTILITPGRRKTDEPEHKTIKIEPEMLLSMEDRRKIAREISRALKGKLVSIRTARAGVTNELDQDLKWLGRFDRCYINGVGSNNLYAIQLCFYDSNNEHLTYNYLLGPRDELGLTFTEKLVNLVSDEGHVITFPLDADYK